MGLQRAKNKEDVTSTRCSWIKSVSVEITIFFLLVCFINICSFKYLGNNTMRKQEVDNGNDPVGRGNEWLGDTDLFIYLLFLPHKQEIEL